MYVKSSNNQSGFKFTQKINSINVYKDTNATKIIAKIYKHILPKFSDFIKYSNRNIQN